MHTRNGFNPDFCIIAPTAYLDYAQRSASHLVLAHLVDTDEEYTDFYKERQIQDADFIIMDNSAYELKEPYSPDKLLELAGLCGAEAIVLPDYPFQPGQVTIDAANKFIPQFKEHEYKTFFVPQSERGDLDGWIESYIWAADNPDIDIIGMSILGIPNALPNIHYAYARVVMTQMLIDRGIFNFEKHHHYLGLNSGVALEIPSLLKMGALDTVDSSGPIWSALLGHEYTTNADSYQSVKKLTTPVDFSIKRTNDTATHTRISHNLSLTLELFDDIQSTTNKWYAE